MADLSWLANEAHQIHGIFSNVFYGLLSLLLIIGVLLEYFKLPMGGMPSITTLVGRAIIAILLLHSYPEITDIITRITDSITDQLGDLNNFKLVLSKMGDRMEDMSWSWVSVKNSAMMIVSFIAFFVLYISVYICEAFMIYTWTLLYVFSPLLIAFFVLPQTSGGTKALFRSLIEVSLWKVVWSVLSTLLWSAALIEMEKIDDTNFITIISFNLILAGSVLLTPLVVNALTKNGLSGLVGNVGGIAVGASVLTPSKVLKGASLQGKRAYNQGLGFARKATENNYPRARRFVRKMPQFNVPKRQTIFKENTNGSNYP